MFINDLSDILESNVKFFADDTSVFWLLVLLLVENKWNMSFHPDPSKQTQG